MRDLGGHGSGRRPPNPGGRGPDNVRHGNFGTNGHSMGQVPGTRIDPLAVDEDEPIDLVELQADDELIHALSSGLGVSGPGNGGYDADDRLVAMLAAWKADVDAEPIPVLVEPDVAVQMLQPARPSRRVGYLRPLVAAAAMAVCALAAVSVGAHSAVPGDALWGVSKVLYSERAGQVQAESDLRTGIEQVNAKLAAGDSAGARADLAAIAPLMARLGPGTDRDLLSKQAQFLAAKAAETPQGVPTNPTAPLKNGTVAPPAPTTEGSADPAPSVDPGSGATDPTGRDPRTGTGSTAPGTSTGPETASPGSPPASAGSDPRRLRPESADPRTRPGDPDPGQQGSSDPSDPREQPQSPTTEGSPDPTPTGPTTRPTASGEGTADPTSSTGVSSTTN